MAATTAETSPATSSRTPMTTPSRGGSRERLFVDVRGIRLNDDCNSRRPGRTIRILHEFPAPPCDRSAMFDRQGAGSRWSGSALNLVGCVARIAAPEKAVDGCDGVGPPRQHGPVEQSFGSIDFRPPRIA